MKMGGQVNAGEGHVLHKQQLEKKNGWLEGKRVEAEYLASGGNAELGMQFINVQTQAWYRKLQVPSDDTRRV